MAEKHSVSIDGKLYSDLKEYCDYNHLKLNAYVEELIRKQFTVEKFGTSPFDMMGGSPYMSQQEMNAIDDYVEKELNRIKQTPPKPAILPPEINEKVASGEALELVEVQPMEPPTIPVPEKPKKKVTRLN